MDNAEPRKSGIPAKPDGLAGPQPQPMAGLFEEFIAHWPECRRRDTEPARSQFARIASTDPGAAQRMLASARLQAADQDWPREGGRYAPLPLKWLRRRRWIDTPDAQATLAEQAAQAERQRRVLHEAHAQQHRPPGLPEPIAVSQAKAQLAELRKAMGAPAQAFQRGGAMPRVTAQSLTMVVAA